jgi:hypothetical protein
MHRLKDKSGPRRKSNAEHAVTFYEYVLERLTADENNVGDKKDDSDDAQGHNVASVTFRSNRHENHKMTLFGPRLCLFRAVTTLPTSKDPVRDERSRPLTQSIQ